MPACRFQHVIDLNNAAARRFGMAASRRDASTRGSPRRHASRATCWVIVDGNEHTNGALYSCTAGPNYSWWHEPKIRALVGSFDVS